jgi:predicted O-methyltransferase YrrM
VSVEGSLATEPAIPQMNFRQPHPARVYDYFLGGKNHFAADRALAEKALAAVPTARTTARENRAFLGRAVRFLAAEAGVRQFLDIGTGLPTGNNAHKIAQAAAPTSRVVYADNDPLVLAHAQALLTSGPQGRTTYIDADLRDPESILTSSRLMEVLDLGQPVALLLLATLQFISDQNDPAGIVATLLDALPSGSYLAATHPTAEHNRSMEDAQRVYADSGIQGWTRDSGEFARLAFDGLKLVPPGVVLVSEWRPDTRYHQPSPAEVNLYGGVARKP